MCGRGALFADVSDLAERFELERHPDAIEPRYNLAPASSGVGAPFIVRLGSDGKRELSQARWWLIPSFWRKPLRELPTTFNARAEDVMHKPFFREAFLKRRCLMPLSAWYEFRGERGRKQSFCFHLPELVPLALAGIWESHVEHDTGEVIESFAIVTTTPTAQAAAVHDRMPVVVPPADYARWLDPRVRDPGKLSELLKPYAGELVVFETSGYGNDPRNEGPRCMEPASERLPGLFD